MVLLAGIIVAGWHCLSRQKGILHRQGIALAYVFSYMSVASLFSFPWQSAMAGPLGGTSAGIGLADANNRPGSVKGDPDDLARLQYAGSSPMTGSLRSPPCPP